MTVLISTFFWFAWDLGPLCNQANEFTRLNFLAFQFQLAGFSQRKQAQVANRAV